MAQRIFDVENEKDMALLWSILPDDINKIEPFGIYNRFYSSGSREAHDFIKINWHDKTEITRPIPLATKKDIGKICAFWEEGNEKYPVYAELVGFYEDASCYKYQAGHESCCYEFCRRLTKQEIEELC